MTSSSIDYLEDNSVRTWFGRQRRVIILAVAGLLAIGALLLWGPIGLGNGPLSAAVYATSGSVHSGRGPVGFVIPIHNSGDSSAVVDGLDFIGGTSYPGPHVLGLEVLTSGRCGGAFPARQTARGFMLLGCGGMNAGPLIGHAFGPNPPVGFGFPTAAEVAAPRPGTCWVMTKIVLGYDQDRRALSRGHQALQRQRSLPASCLRQLSSGQLRDECSIISELTRLGSRFTAAALADT